MTRQQITQRLIELAIENGGWTQVSLARRLRVSAKHMNQVWNLKAAPSLELLEDWAHLLGCTLRVSVELVEPRGVS